MKRLIPIVIVLIQILLMSSCQQTTKTDDPQKLKAVLLGFFDGIETKNFQKIKDLTTDDFVLFDDGSVLNTDILINVIKDFNFKTAKYTLENLKITVDNNTGSINYFNHFDAVLKDTTHVAFNWLESATFKKIDNKWQINFLHSTIRK